MAIKMYSYLSLPLLVFVFVLVLVLVAWKSLCDGSLLRNNRQTKHPTRMTMYVISCFECHFVLKGERMGSKHIPKYRPRYPIYPVRRTLLVKDSRVCLASRGDERGGEA
jgi:hypothetical protein